jgi:sodium/potassium-transporting ATPase subunit alpha
VSEIKEMLAPGYPSESDSNEGDAKSPESPVPAAVRSLHKIARLCNGAKFTAEDASSPIEERAIKGDATDTAILRFAESLSSPSAGFDSATLVASHEQVLEIPFNSKNKWMLTVVRERGATTTTEPCMFIKGAPDVLFPSCTTVMNADGSIVRLDNIARQKLSALQSDWSSEGQRVLALCQRSLGGIKLDTARMSSNEIEELMYSQLEDLTLVGLVGIRDPPRYDVADALKIIRRAGVKIFMVTGDFKLTAVAIAKQVGFR